MNDKATILDDKLVEEKIPNIRMQGENETTPEYFNYVFDVIEDRMFDESPRGRIIDVDRSPVVKIWKMSVRPYPMHLEDVSKMHKWIKQIGLIKKSLSQRGTIIHKVAFYYIWSRYEEGKTWNYIYDQVATILELKGDRENTIRAWKKYPKTFGWSRVSTK